MSRFSKFVKRAISNPVEKVKTYYSGAKDFYTSPAGQQALALGGAALGIPPQATTMGLQAIGGQNAQQTTQGAYNLWGAPNRGTTAPQMQSSAAQVPGRENPNTMQWPSVPPGAPTPRSAAPDRRAYLWGA